MAKCAARRASSLAMLLLALSIRAGEQFPGHEGCEGGFGAGAVISAEGLSGFSASAVPRPSVVSRTQWGCPEGQQSSWTPQYTTVTHLVVHHSAGSNNSSDWAATVRSIWSFHSRPVSEGGRGWGDIGYNFLIDPNGVIYEGRAGGDNAIAAHFSCRNGGTMGVCLLGNFQSASPSAAATQSLKRLLAWKASQLNLAITGTRLHPGTGLILPQLCGHRDANPSYPEEACNTTACPGERLYAALATIRTDVQAMIDAAESQPVLVALPATALTTRSARLWAKLETPGNPILERRFEWGVDGTFTRWTANVFSSGGIFFADAANLAIDTEYQFRFSARTSSGWVSSEPIAFRTRTSVQIALGTAAGGALEVIGQPGTSVTIEGSHDLVTWQPLQGAQIPSGGVLRLQFNLVAWEKRFYRASAR